MTYYLPETATTRNSIHHMDLFTLCNAMDDESVDMILCDLPYGTTACSWDTIIPIEPMWTQFKRIIKPRGAIVLTASQPFTSRLVSSNYEMFQYELLWIKAQGKEPQLCNIRPQKAHENIAVFALKKSPSYYPQFWEDVPYNKKAATSPQSLTHAPGFWGLSKTKQTERYPLSYMYFISPVSKHPTQKPVALFEYLIKTYTLPGQLVFDPCVGSGTTAVAARNTGRDYICGDFTREYVEMARERIQNSDPYQPSIQKNGMKQLSLFG